MELELKNKNVLVTGSNRGTGQVIAESFVREGARVFFTGLKPSQNELNERKPDLGDITTDDGADQVFQQVREQVSHLDILVNNYGKASQGKWQSLSIRDWIDIYEINTSIVRMVQRFDRNACGKQNHQSRDHRLNTPKQCHAPLLFS